MGLCAKRIPYSFLQNFYTNKFATDDLRHRVESARELVMIHDELLMVQSFTA